MSFFHSHCKECDKSIPFLWDYCSLECELAEQRRYRDLVRASLELEQIKAKAKRR